MKIPIFIILLLFTSCSRYSDRDFTELQSKNAQLQNEINSLMESFREPRITFVGKNSVNSAYYYISIACTKPAPPFIYIPDDQSVEIYLMDDCEVNKIPPDILFALSQKEFHYVSWFTMFMSSVDNERYYKFSDEEVRLIAQGKWKYLVAPEYLSKEQYKILRNTKNIYRIAFEPTGDVNIFTTTDKEKCDAFWGDAIISGNEMKFSIASKKVSDCYRSFQSE